MTRITQQNLESYLWGAAVLLRGTIDAGDYKQFIFPLLFFKRLCDVYEEEIVTALRNSGGDLDFALFPENHRFHIPAAAHWKEIRKVNRDVGPALQQAMRSIESANQNKLLGIFGDAQWTNKDRLSDTMLRDLIEHFSTLELTVASLPEDELGQGYEYLIKKFADDSGHTAAEFYTNRTVVHLMTEMLDVQPGESVYDPTCGTGGMLLSCISHLRNAGNEWRNVRLYGQERNMMTSSIARMNCFLHGIEDFRIERGDTLAEPKFVEGDRLQRFDVVLANPPYSIKQWNREAFGSDPWGRNLFGVPPQGRADYAFQQHIFQSLNPHSGRCAVLWPHGVLFRIEEADIRRKLIEADLIECVIGLGPNLFYNSPMEACIVICRTNKAEQRRGKILFINAVKEVTRERSQSFLTDEQLRRIVRSYKDFKTEPGFTKVARLDEIRAKSGNLSIPLYVEADASFIHEDAILEVRAALDKWIWCSQEMRSIWSDSDRTKSVQTINNFDNLKVNLDMVLLPILNRTEWTPVKFGDVVENCSETCDPVEAGLEHFIAMEHLSPGSLMVRTWGKVSDGTTFTRLSRPGQVLFGKRRAYQRKVAVAEFDAVVSGDIYVFQSKDTQRFLSELLPFICLSERFFQHAVGTSAGSLSPRTNWTSLSSFEFSLPSLHVQRKISEILWAIERTERAWEDVRKDIDQVRSSYATRKYGVFEDSQNQDVDSIRLSELADVNPKLERKLEESQLVTFIGMADVSEDGRVKNSIVRPFSEVRKGFTGFKDGDILFAKITPCMENGKGAHVSGLCNGVGFGSTEFHVIRPKDEEDTKYVLYLTMLPQFRNIAKRSMRGSAGQQRVPADFLKEFRVLSADKNERSEIGRTLSILSEQIDLIEEIQGCMRHLRKSLLSLLFGESNGV